MQSLFSGPAERGPLNSRLFKREGVHESFLIGGAPCLGCSEGHLNSLAKR
jgi:hypothetical protein